VVSKSLVRPSRIAEEIPYTQVASNADRDGRPTSAYLFVWNCRRRFAAKVSAAWLFTTSLVPSWQRRAPTGVPCRAKLGAGAQRCPRGILCNMSVDMPTAKTMPNPSATSLIAK
jgi:hypothetical protein